MVDDTSLLQHLEGKVAVVTGGANGIGAQTAKSLSLWGSKVVIADLESTAGEAERLIASLPHPTNALFVPTNVLNWEQMKRLFRRTIERFGRVDVVVANAGIMESRSVFDLRAVDDGGELEESLEGFRVLDVNLKGTLNSKSSPLAAVVTALSAIRLSGGSSAALRLALYHMQSNEPCFPDSSRGSIVLVTSTSGYFGSSGVGAYVASKHGLVGLLRSSQLTSRAVNIKVNAVAPFFTPTPTFSKLSGKLGASGLRANTLEDVGNAIAHICLAPGSGKCLLVLPTFFSFVKPSLC